MFPYAPLVKRDKEHRRHSTFSRQVQNIVRADCEKKKKQERKLLLDMGGLDVQKLYYPWTGEAQNPLWLVWLVLGLV